MSGTRAVGCRRTRELVRGRSRESSRGYYHTRGLGGGLTWLVVGVGGLVAVVIVAMRSLVLRNCEGLEFGVLELQRIQIIGKF